MNPPGTLLDEAEANVAADDVKEREPSHGVQALAH